MQYHCQFYPYRRPFKYPLSTSHGNWEVREGIILRLTDATGQVGWGEVAPLDWFGSESWEQALNFCHQLGSKITASNIYNIPTELPACQFGFESAQEMLADVLQSNLSSNSIAYSFLLPAGEAALQSWQTGWNQGFSTFKWKIGVASIEEELQVFDQLRQALPSGVRLRLDANGGLSTKEAHQWLRACDDVEIVEFLEQPLPLGQFEAMLEMTHQYATAIALDESVATLEQLEVCYQRGWRGIFVIKPAIAGSPRRLRQFCRENSIDAVFSSVLETTIGRKAALRLARELLGKNRALGFGVTQWFQEDGEIWLKEFLESSAVVDGVQ